LKGHVEVVVKIGGQLKPVRKLKRKSCHKRKRSLVLGP
jgi:hypothetical protein